MAETSWGNSAFLLGQFFQIGLTNFITNNSLDSLQNAHIPFCDMNIGSNLIIKNYIPLRKTSNCYSSML